MQQAENWRSVGLCKLNNLNVPKLLKMQKVQHAVHEKGFFHVQRHLMTDEELEHCELDEMELDDGKMMMLVDKSVFHWTVLHEEKLSEERFQEMMDKLQQNSRYREALKSISGEFPKRLKRKSSGGTDRSFFVLYLSMPSSWLERLQSIPDWLLPERKQSKRQPICLDKLLLPATLPAALPKSELPEFHGLPLAAPRELARECFDELDNITEWMVDGKLRDPFHLFKVLCHLKAVASNMQDYIRLYAAAVSATQQDWGPAVASWSEAVRNQGDSSVASAKSSERGGARNYEKCIKMASELPQDKSQQKVADAVDGFVAAVAYKDTLEASLRKAVECAVEGCEFSVKKLSRILEKAAIDGGRVPRDILRTTFFSKSFRHLEEQLQKILAAHCDDESPWRIQNVKIRFSDPRSDVKDILLSISHKDAPVFVEIQFQHQKVYDGARKCFNSHKPFTTARAARELCTI